MKNLQFGALVLVTFLPGCMPKPQDTGSWTPIYIYSEQELPRERYDLEEDLQSFLGSRGEITGGGGGSRGWNIDLDVNSESAEEIIQGLGPFLKEWGVGKDTYFEVFPPDWVEGDSKRRIDVFSEED